MWSKHFQRENSVDSIVEPQQPNKVGQLVGQNRI